MLLQLFYTFFKINCLSTSGPASIGITQKLIVPSMVSVDKFNEIIAISSGIPGSDAMQIAWQVGYEVHGIIGALFSVLGALIPSILLVSIVLIGIKFISPDILKKFFNGVNPALAVFLTVTALSLLPTHIQLLPIFIVLLTILMFYLKIPLLVILIVGGTLGILFS